MEDDYYGRLINAYNLLLDRGILHTRKKFGEYIGMRETHLSTAFKGDVRYCTLGLMRRIADAFPEVINREYMEHGIGDVAKRHGIPHVPIEAAAGGLNVALGSASLEQCELNEPIGLFSHYDFTIEVMGDSMTPELRSGDILACKWADASNINPTKYYVLDTNEGAVVKSLQDKGEEIVCTSLNEAYGEFIVAKRDVLHLAVVVGVMRKF